MPDIKSFVVIDKATKRITQTLQIGVDQPDPPQPSGGSQRLVRVRAAIYEEAFANPRKIPKLDERTADNQRRDDELDNNRQLDATEDRPPPRSDT